MTIPKLELNFTSLGTPPKSSPTVAKLLRSPMDVLQSEQHWPKPGDMADAEAERAMSFTLWLEHRFQALGGEYAKALRWRPVWGAPPDAATQALDWLSRFDSPGFPVGKACPEFGDVPNRTSHPAWVAARHAMPFEDNCYAALILSIPASDGSGDPIFLLTEQSDMKTMIDGDWVEAGPTWVITGEIRTDIGPSDERAPILAYARRWWRSMAGLPVRPGRPKNTHFRTFDEVLDRLSQWKSDHGPIPPRLEDFLDEFLWDVSPQSKFPVWKRHTKSWGWTWEKLLPSVYGDVKRTSRRRRAG